MTDLLTPPAASKPSCVGYRPVGAMWNVWNSRALEMLVDGPAGSSKTRGILELFYLACQKYPGCRVAFCMAQRVDMSETILQSFEDEVLPEGSPLVLGAKRAHRTKYILPNGSEIILVGLDDVQRTRGLQVDWVYVGEATNITLDQWEMLGRCTRFGVIPYTRMVADTNPGSPAHWLLSRCDQFAEDGSRMMERVQVLHKDNPKYWNRKTGDWTEAGHKYVKQRLSRFTGVRKLRMVDGLWVAEEGSVFDPDLMKAIGDVCYPPSLIGRFELTSEGVLLDERLKEGDPACVRFVECRAEDADVKLWLPLERNGRVHQVIVPVGCADVSWGQGASNSVFAAGDRNTGRKIVEFASAKLAPEVFARYMVGIGYWLGGQRGRAMLGWEANGPGMSVAKIIVDTLAYPWVYRDVETSTGRDRPGKRAGVWMDRQRKIDLAMGYQDALRSGRYINPSRAAIDEAVQWVRYPSGEIGPARMERESPEARSTHGDRVIADMILAHAMEQAPLVPMPKVIPPVGSVARDLLEMEAEKRREEEWD